MDLIKRLSISDVLDRFVIHSCPEEGDLTVRDNLVHHVVCSKGSLVKSNVPVFNSHALTGLPVREGSNITSGEDIFDRGLHKRIANYATRLIKLNISIF